MTGTDATALAPIDDPTVDTNVPRLCEQPAIEKAALDMETGISSNWFRIILMTGASRAAGTNQLQPCFASIGHEDKAWPRGLSGNVRCVHCAHCISPGPSADSNHAHPSPTSYDWVSRQIPAGITTELSGAGQHELPYPSRRMVKRNAGLAMKSGLLLSSLRN